AFAESLIVTDLDIDALELARLHDPRRRSEQIPEDLSRKVEHVFVSDPKEMPGKALPASPPAEYLDDVGEAYEALVTGTRDYVHKNGFETVIVGVSGGIDSSLVATIATDALGPDHVVAISNPSRYSSEGSIGDARLLTDNLGVRLTIIPIEGVHS